MSGYLILALFTVLGSSALLQGCSDDHVDHDGHDHDDDHDGHDHDDDHDGHNHGGEWFEWGGVVELTAGETYTWAVTRGSDGNYTEPNYGWIAYPTKFSNITALQEVYGDSTEWWVNGTIDKVTAGDTIVLNETRRTSARLTFNKESWISIFNLEAVAGGLYVFFIEHSLLEFQAGYSFLQANGQDVKPLYMYHHDGHDHGGHDGHDHGDHDGHDHDDHDDDDDHEETSIWLALGGSFITTLPAMAAMAVMGPGLVALGKDFMSQFIPFASGAIAGTAFFLILPESFHLMGGEEEIVAWGFTVLGGWLATVAVQHVTAVTVGHDHGREITAESSPTEGVQVALSVGESDSRPAPLKLSLAIAILVGDFLHGIVDGIVVGFAAKACGAEVTWGVILATIGHEAPQEIGDYIVLITEANMPWRQAFFWNSLAAQGALLGALFGYLVEVSDYFEGVVLALCAGVFMFISLSELYPYFTLRKKTWLESAFILLSFSAGVGLLSLFAGHAHCDPGGHGHGGGHDGHNH